MIKDMTLIKNFEITAGADIKQVAIRAIQIANEDNCIVTFNFNGIDLKVYSFENDADIVENYYKGLKNKAKIR